MHSPFVFNFIQHVLNNKSGYQPPGAIEALREQLIRNKELLEIEDLGAGSRTGAKKERTIQQLATSAVKPRKFGHFFYRLVKYYQPTNIIELGTSLGITTAYLATANIAAKIITIEGSGAIHQQAMKNFKELDLHNISLFKGNFDTLLPEVLNNIDTVDLAYIDGNHRYRPTIDYFHQLMCKRNNNTTFVFDDIHWSSEMERAWQEIKEHPDVLCTVDLFFLGLVFFRKEFKEKQHFSIRF